MENNEIMINEDVIEVAEEITPAGINKALVVVAGVAAALVVGGLVYNKVIKPAIAKAKAKKERKAIELSEDDYNSYYDDFEDVEVVEVEN